jgi:hypothetical protein
MAIDPQDLPAIKRELKTFRRNFEEKYKKPKAKKAVYCLSMQFFSLTTEPVRTCETRGLASSPKIDGDLND